MADLAVNLLGRRNLQDIGPCLQGEARIKVSQVCAEVAADHFVQLFPLALGKASVLPGKNVGLVQGNRNGKALRPLRLNQDKCRCSGAAVPHQLEVGAQTRKPILKRSSLGTHRHFLGRNPRQIAKTGNIEMHVDIATDGQEGIVLVYAQGLV